MILVDSNIIIDFLRHPDKETKERFSSPDIAICGVVKAEILHGARSLEHCRKILEALEDFPCLEMQEDDWETLGRNLYLLRSNSVTVPFQDAIIATLAIRNNVSVWTRDKHFSMIKEILAELKIEGNS